MYKITIKKKLYKSKRTKYLDKQVKVACEIYNHFIAYQKIYYKLSGRYCCYYDMSKICTSLKRKDKYKHWSILTSHCIQEILERIDNSYKKFFKEKSKKNKNINYKNTRPPSFKKESKYRSITFKANNISVANNLIRISNKYYKFHKKENITKIKIATFKKDCIGDWYVYIVCEIDYSFKQQNRAMTGKIAGFDFGLKTFLTSNNGEKIECPEFYKQSLKLIRIADKALNNKQKGSNNRIRARINLARVHKKITNQRKDFQFKLAKELVIKYDIIFLENLNLEKMKKLWGRKVSDLGFGQFVEILKHQANKYGSKIVFIPKFYPSSKTCSNCDFINENLTLNDREWDCPNCKIHHNRDHNAAKNIYRVGASTLITDNVRPALAGIC